MDLSGFKPNQFAALSAYHAVLLHKVDYQPRNGFHRWCFARRGFVAGDSIDLKTDEQKSMQRPEAETHKFAQARLKQNLSDEPSVNMIEIARHVSRTSTHRTELESLLATPAGKTENTMGRFSSAN